ncbi:hypothetical protein DFH06DRAFT_1156064 [Mycena polygramma]|nr:hypothetical protein DFH06DRAFT_1156064 [Mycena polygramma]
MTASLAAARTALAALRARPTEDLVASTHDGISLLALKPPLLLSYMQSLLLLSAHRALGHTLAERSAPSAPFSDLKRGPRGADGGDLVDAAVEGRVVLEKVRALEGRMRYQIEKLVRAAAAPESAPGAAVDDPLAFRPNPANLANDAASDVEEDSHTHARGYRDRGDRDSDIDDRDGLYRPPRLAPVPYTGASLPTKGGKRTRAPPVPSALRALADPALPHAETTSGLGGTPALESSRAKYLRRLQDFEEENFGRVVLGKGADKRRARDEEDMALGAELGSGTRGGGKNRRRGGLEDEFGDVLRSGERGVRARAGVGSGDGYDELRRGAKKKNVLERSRVRVRETNDDVDGDGESHPRKKSRFEQDTKTAKRRVKRST